MKQIIFSILVIITSLVGCSKDKNMEDYRREQLQQSITRINAVSGTYTGPVISEIDGSNLGIITLKFQARTDIQSNSGFVTNEQRAIVSGSLSFKSLNLAEVLFDNGYYDDETGDFQVTIPISQEGSNNSKLFLVGVVRGNKWVGSIEAQGQPDFGGRLDLTKNASSPNVFAIESEGARLQQLKRLDFEYVGSYIAEGVSTPFRLSFLNRDILPELNFYKLFSPVRTVNLICDFTDFELNFSNALIDDKAGTLFARDPVDQRGSPVRANLFCTKFGELSGEFGWDCQIQTKTTALNLHLTAKQ